ncbi:MAG: AraC family transcriptional regulator ligand-binding domain-containing protein [Lysobacterales bacterium]
MDSDDTRWRIPATYLKVMAQQARARAVPLSKLIAGTDFQTQAERPSDEAVSLEDTLVILRNARRLMGTGWHLALGAQLSAPTHGPLGFAVVTAARFGAAVQVLLRFVSTRAPFVWVAGQVEGEQFVLRVFETVDLVDQRETLIELAMLSVQHLLERPLGRELSGAHVALAYPPPACSHDVEHAFHTTVEFDAPVHALRFPAVWLEQPCALADKSMHQYLISRCEDDLRNTLGLMPVAMSVRQALLARTGRMPTLSEVAAAQHVSSRTLMRRLKRSGTSYQEILDHVRQTLGRESLRYSQLSISDLSQRLGYRDPANFSRAFKRWYGTSPTDFRARGL